MKFLYLVPSDGDDRRRDGDESIATLAEHLRRWVADQPDDQWLKLDTYLGKPDVGFVRTSYTEQEIHELGGDEAPIPILADIRAAGFDDPDTIYVAVYEGGMGGRTADRRMIVLPS